MRNKNIFIRRLGAFALGVCSLAFVVGCGDTSEPKTYTVTFKQSGYGDILREVEEGSALTDVPTPVLKNGYSVVWDTTDFSSITGDMTVNAVATANTYTVTYDADGGSVFPFTDTFTFDSAYELAVPEFEGFIFDYWTLNGAEIPSSGVWKYAADVELVAEWIGDTVCSVTFYQEGESKIVKYVDRGDTLTDIPVPAIRGGYTMSWDTTDFSNITKNLKVNAVATPNKYVVTYDANGGEISSETQDVYYNTAYELLTPTREGYLFNGWKRGSLDTALEGTWSLMKDVTLVADWVKSYRVYLDFGLLGYEAPAGVEYDGVKGAYYMEVGYGAEYVLPVLAKDGYEFKGWILSDGTAFSDGVYTTEADVEIKAVWKTTSGGGDPELDMDIF